jgi:NADH:ubiquinone oxidoreductase subunit F (NADH-binding)
MIAQKNPHQIIEGVAIACYGIGAKKAFIYLNGKFRQAELMLEQAICQAKEENFLGEQISGSDFNLEIEIFSGAGAYVCGEESALINSIEGVRGEPRFKPPYPCTYGLYGKPTVVNNAETMANISWIIINGAAAYKMIGTRQSPGTKLFCIDGAVKHPGLYEAPIGRSVYDLIYEYAGGIKSGCRYWFAQLGGASGRLIPSVRIDLIPAFDRDAQLPLGSGTLLVFDKNQDTRELILSWLNFFQRESCGKCVPCREGLFRLKAIFERNIGDCWNQNDLEDIAKLIWTLENTTFCPLGKFSVVGLQEAIKYKLIEF